MKKTFLSKVGEYQELHRDPRSGIAWVEDGSTGWGHSVHPNIDRTGSVRGMKQLGYWSKDARTVRSHGFIYNIDSLVVTDPWDEIARQHCCCGSNHYLARLYECGICSSYHPWQFRGDCREDRQRFASPEEFAVKHGVHPLAVEVLSWEDRTLADEAEDFKAPLGAGFFKGAGAR